MRVVTGSKLGIAGVFALFGAACASGPPALKEGLWEIHAQSVEKPAERKTALTYKLCRDHAYDKAANALLKSVKGCSTAVKELGGGKIASASTCNVNGVSIVSNGVTTFLGEQQIHSETQAQYSPPFNGKSAESMIQDQQYVGVCPPSMRVGDTISAEGFIQHHN
jgi:hypothetical protein